MPMRPAIGSLGALEWVAAPLACVASTERRMTAGIDLTLAGAGVHFTCTHAPLLNYARAHMAPLLSDSPAAAPEISAQLRWHEGHPPSDPLATRPAVRSFERLDRDLYGAPGTLLWRRVDDLRDLHLWFEWDGARLRIEGDYYHRLSPNRRGDLARRLVYRHRLESLRRKRFTRLIYYLIYYPVFWWLEHVARVHPLHAAAVETPAGTVLLAGPSGVGKSTLTVALAATPGARMLSDTFVLHRGPEVWAVPEPVLLDQWSRTWLGDAASVLRTIPEQRYALGRDGYVPRREHLALQSRVALVVLPRRVPERFVRAVSGAEAMWRIDAYDDIVNDLRRYRAMASVLELTGPTGLGAARLESLNQLAAAVRCYEVGLTPDLSRAEAVGMILDLLHGNLDRAQPPVRRHG